ncbi:MAG: CPBP family intramembrane glutamic endopeptidase [Verrucomicrobiales bacterium]
MVREPFFRSSAFKIQVFLLGTVLLGALLAPPLYFAGKHMAAEGWLKDGWLGGLHQSMEKARFTRYFSRSILLGAMLMIWPTLRWFNAGKSGRTSPKRSVLEQFQLDPNPSWWKHGLIGFLLAGGILLLLGWSYVQLGWYTPRDPGMSIAKVILGALGTGIAVGFLEEFVFRGAIHSVLAKVLKPRSLFWVIAVVFALIHFFNPPKTLNAEVVDAFSGFWMVGKVFEHFFQQFGQLYFLFAEFAVLLAIGVVLGYTRMKTGSLWLGTGLHAGWVFGVKTLGATTQQAFGPGEMMPWLGPSLRVGALSCLFVCLTGLIVWVWIRKQYGDPFAPRE